MAVELDNKTIRDMAYLEAPFDIRRIQRYGLKLYLEAFEKLFWRHNRGEDVDLMVLTETLVEGEKLQGEGKGNSNGGKHSRPAPHRL